MIYNSGKKEKYCDMCGKCKHFSSSGITVVEIDHTYHASHYANTVVGECDLHQFDDGNTLRGVEHFRWETHSPCLDFDDCND